MYRMPRSARSAAAAPPGRRAPLARRALTALLAAVVSVTAAACEGGPIAQSTALSNGKSYVTGNYGTITYKAGSRPTAPVVSGRTLAGRQLSLRSFRGDVIVLNFWASWCGPCRQEAPVLAALARLFKPDRVQFVGVDLRDNATGAEAFMRTFEMSYPSLSDPDSEIALAFRDSVQPDTIPSTLVIDRSGRISGATFGEVSYSGLKSLINEVRPQNHD